jgi:hypothetical protein
MAFVSPFVKASIEKKTGMSYGDYQAEQAAKSAGFSSAAAQMQNRMMRNQLEEKAARLGVSNQQAYSLAGSDLTNTQALQNAWNRLTGPGPAPATQAAPPPAAPQAPPPSAPAPTGPSQSDLMLQSLQDSIASMQQGFMESMQQNAMQFQQMQQAQNERMEALQQMMIQSQASQAERPTVAGVKTAVGQSGTPMQIARRGVSGSFGRKGMRIQALNV